MLADLETLLAREGIMHVDRLRTGRLFDGIGDLVMEDFGFAAKVSTSDVLIVE